MPNDTHPNPTTLDYQPVTKDRRRTPTWLVVFVVGFGVGVVWVLGIWHYCTSHRVSPSEWASITVYPAEFVGYLLFQRWHFGEIATVGGVCSAVGLSYGLLALLGYGLYRRLQQRLTAAV